MLKLIKTFDSTFGEKYNGVSNLAVSYSQIDLFINCPNRWFREYILGEKDTEKQEALSYGSVIHSVLEEYLKSNRKLSEIELIELYDKFATEEQIPFISDESREESNLQAKIMCKRIKESENLDIKSQSILESLMTKGESVGIEEPFIVEYKLPKSVIVDGIEYDKVFINGFIDYHPIYKGEHYLLDHKSGRKIFKQKKLDENLQFPIYSMYLYRKYEVLPKECIYNFTRTGEFQIVKVDMNRIYRSVEILNNVFSQMYNPKQEYKCNPTPLCFWCQFGFYNKNTCVESSKYRK